MAGLLNYFNVGVDLFGPSIKAKSRQLLHVSCCTSVAARQLLKV
jgi:hypothetical protein